MKARKILTLIISFVFIGYFQIAQAQTFQQDLHATIDNEYVFCLNKQLTGSWTYHMSYHIDKKTGVLSNLHWNVKHAELYDSDGNKYKYTDTGNDNLGFWWEFFNNVNAFNEGFNIEYDVEDGWLPGIPEVLPEEGRLVEASFQFKGNGEKVTWKYYYRVKLDNTGQIQVILEDEYLDCNE